MVEVPSAFTAESAENAEDKALLVMVGCFSSFVYGVKFLYLRQILKVCRIQELQIHWFV